MSATHVRYEFLHIGGNVLSLVEPTCLDELDGVTGSIEIGW
ncbi:MAG: hypothetical protein ABSA03_17665 [Streptosporangiaceae bacterium]|jgi:hypothetical protein